jgi:hypothetical protein
VAGDYDAESCSLRLQIQLREIVQDVNRDAGGLQHFGFWQPVRPGGFVDVAANRRHGREFRELFENFGRANVAGVNDLFGSAQSRDCLGTKQAVRVGNDADDDGSSQLWVLRSEDMCSENIDPDMSAFISACGGASSMAV